MGWKNRLLARAASLILGAATTIAACGQSAIPQTTEDALHAMTDAAGVIFTGTVTAVRRPSSAGVVEIDFAVTDAIRGVSGSAYTLREWAGLWEASDEPFRPGQRYLMLLHAPNSAGLSSPVGGPDGAIPIRATPAQLPATQNPTAYDAVAALQNAGDESIDLGWIGTRVAVPVTYRPSTPARPILTGGVQTDAPPAQNPNATQSAPDRLRTAPYSSVLNMLRKPGSFDAR